MTAAMNAPDDPLLGETLGGYRLVRKLGQGGMGAVYEATTAEGQRAAVKVISTTSRSTNLVRRFLREARATRSVESRHVVRVLDAAGDEGGKSTPFLALELLDGLDLDTLIKRSGALEPRAVARVFIQAARGLAAAHARSLIHRDIKPANLFLHEEGEGLIVTKICDFGVAKSTEVSEDHAASVELTHTGGMLGSPLYMSPEQASNAKGVDHRTDIWSLCLSMYQALSGKKPWENCSMVGQLILTICTQDITPLQDLAPWVSPELAATVHKGLEREPTKRWATSAELAEALEPLALPGEVTRQDLCSLTAEQREQVAVRHPGASPRRAVVLLPRAVSLGPLTRSDSGEPFTLSGSRETPPLSSSLLTATQEPLSDADTPASDALVLAVDPASVAPADLPAAPLPAAIALATSAGISGSSAATEGLVSSRSAGQRGRPRPLVAGLGVAAICLFAGAAIWKGRGEPEPRAMTAAPQVATPRAVVHQVTVRVSPPEARVTIGGSPRSLSPAGELSLEGEAGESFEVAAEARGVSRRVRVLISREGDAEPGVIELPTPQGATSPGASAPGNGSTPSPPPAASPGAGHAAVGKAVPPAAPPAARIDPARIDPARIDPARIDPAGSKSPATVGDPKMHADL